MTLGALREQRRRQLEDRLRAGSRWHDDGFVFASTVGTASDARNEAGEGLFVVSRILGHTSVATTASFYGHVRPAMLQRSAERMNERSESPQHASGVKRGDGDKIQRPSGCPEGLVLCADWW